MPTYSKNRLPYNLLKKQYLKPGGKQYDYFSHLAAWIRASGISSNKYGVSTVQQGVVQNEFAPTRHQFPAFYVNEGSAGGGPEFKISHSSVISNTFGPGPDSFDGFFIGFWFKLVEFSHADSSSAGSNLICITDGTSGQRIMDVFCSESGANLPQVGIRFYDAVSPSTKFVEMKSAFGINAREWNHVAFWVDGNFSLNVHKNADYIFILNGEFPNTGGWQESETYSAAAGSQISTAFSSNSVVVKFGNGGGSSNPSTNTVENSHMNGYISDVAIYNTGVPAGISFHPNFAPTDVSLLWKLSVLGAYYEQSGFLNNPERIMRNTLDERSYWPSTLKVGDQRRPGNPSIKWDDLKRPEYTTTQVNYPSLLHRNDTLLTSSIYRTRVDGQLNVPRNTRTIPRYAYDMFYEREDETSFLPFSDSRILNTRNMTTDFYLSGSSIAGFTGSLSEKDVVVMNFRTTNDLYLNNIDYTAASTGDENKYMAYLNPTTKDFDALNGIRFRDNVPTGLFGNASDAQTNAQIKDLYRRACIGFSPAPKVLYASSNHDTFDKAYYLGSGTPFCELGFPRDKRYDASPNQIIRASDYIQKPFLIEKILIDLPNISMNRDIVTNIGGAQHRRMNPTTSNPSTTQLADFSTNQLTFFIMRQYKNPHSVSINYNYLSSSKSATIQPGSNFYQFINEGHSSATDGFQNRSHIFTGSLDREIITYANILTHGSLGITDDNLREVGFFDLYDRHATNNTSGTGGTYRFVGRSNSDSANIGELDPIEVTPKTLASRPSVHSIKLQSVQNIGGTPEPMGLYKLQTSWQGGSSNLGLISSARCFSDSVASSADNVTIGLPDTSNKEPLLPVEYPRSISTGSVYLLMPEDELVIGIQAQAPYEMSSGWLRNQVLVEDGRIKLQFFGSYIEDSKPKRTMLNQSNGYTEAVHGAIGEISIHDQFDISYAQEFSGSIPDHHMAMSVFYNPNGANRVLVKGGMPERDGISSYPSSLLGIHKGIDDLNSATAGLASNGTIDVYGSLDRNYRIIENEIYDVDSIAFNVKEIQEADGYPAAFEGGPTVTLQYIGLGDHDASFNPHWSFSFPFEDKYSSVNRLINRVSFVEKTPIVSVRSATYGKYLLGPPNFPLGFSEKSEDLLSVEPNLSGNILEWFYTMAQEIIFGIGSGHRGIHEGFQDLSVSLNRTFRRARGAKYGLSNFRATSRSAVIRRTSHGQFRDLLEPRLYGPTVDDTLTQIDDPIVSRVLISNGAVEFLSAADSVIGNKDENYKVKVPFFDIDKVASTTSTVQTNNVVTTIIDSL